MFSLELECSPEQKDFLIAELWEQGSTGIVELSETRLRAFFEDGADVGRFTDASRRHEPRHDWVAHSRALWGPVLVGSRFFLVPDWRDDPAPPGRFRLAINPGQAFGTGVHETTQLCLEALEQHVRPGMAVLDVGAGSGILCRAAALLGAQHVYGSDLDPIAAEVAHHNTRLVFIGSADSVRSRSVDLIVANISAEAVAQLAPELLRCLRPDGILLLSGFERNEVDPLRSLFPSSAVRCKGIWALLEYPVHRHD